MQLRQRLMKRRKKIFHLDCDHPKDHSSRVVAKIDPPHHRLHWCRGLVGSDVLVGVKNWLRPKVRLPMTQTAHANPNSTR
jgi:hypothetical protein